MGYLPGLLTLHHSLYHPSPDARSTPTSGPNNSTTNPAQPSRYPFVALYTSTFPPEGLKILQSRGIQAQWVPNVTPASTREYAQDPRFAETWTKLVAFSLEEYERVVLLDGDILVRRNMDELMEIELDSRESLEADGDGSMKRVFAAAHACACNPMKKEHYPANWYVSSLFALPRHPICPIYDQSFNTDQHKGSPKTAPTQPNTPPPTKPNSPHRPQQQEWAC